MIERVRKLTRLGPHPVLIGRYVAHHLGRRVHERRLRSGYDALVNRPGAPALRLVPIELPPADSLPEAAERIRGRTIPGELAAALDDWARIRGRKDEAGAKRLRAVAYAADPDPRRNRLRDTIDSGQGTVLKELSALDEIDRRPGAIEGCIFVIAHHGVASAHYVDQRKCLLQLSIADGPGGDSESKHQYRNGGGNRTLDGFFEERFFFFEKSSRASCG